MTGCKYGYGIEEMFEEILIGCMYVYGIEEMSEEK